MHNFLVRPQINWEIRMHESPWCPTLQHETINCLLMYAYNVLAGTSKTSLEGEVEVGKVVLWTLPLTKHKRRGQHESLKGLISEHSWCCLYWERGNLHPNVAPEITRIFWHHKVGITGEMHTSSLVVNYTLGFVLYRTSNGAFHQVEVQV